MGISCFGKGQLIYIDNTEYKMLRSINENDWQIENNINGRIETYNLEELLNLYGDKRLSFLDTFENETKYENRVQLASSFDLLSLKENNKAKMRYAYLMEIKNQKVEKYTEDMLKPIIKKVWNKIKSPETPPHWVTVYRWNKKFIKSGNDIRSLATRNVLKGNRTKRYSEQLDEIVTKAINIHYLTLQKNTITDTYLYAVRLIDRENKLLPKEMHLPDLTRSYVESLIKNIDEYDKCVARDGKQAASRKYRSTLSKIACERPLERVEIDHTLLDLFVIDEKTSLPLGRPWVTSCIDVMTRCIMGIYVGFEPPSQLSVGRCLQHAIMPKTEMKVDYPNIKNKWASYGVMEKLVVDNGLEFHSKGLDALCFPFGIDIVYTPRKTPWFKPHIERFFGELNRNVAHITPGTTFSNILHKGDYDPTKHANVSLSTLKEMITMWIVDFYHQKPHGSIGMSPAESWAKYAQYNQIPLPSSPTGIDILLGHTDERTLSHKGIELFGLRYNCPDLNNIRITHGERLKVTIRYDGGDIGHLYVIHPTSNEYIYVPAIDQKYADGLGLWQHNICKKYVLNYMNKRKDIKALAEAKEKIRELIERDMVNKKMKTRARAERFRSGDGSNYDSPPTYIQIEPELDGLYSEDIVENNSLHIDDDSFVPQQLDTIIEDRNITSEIDLEIDIED